MTDIIADIEGAYTRVEAHIKNLLDNGAPHQTALGNDMQAVLEQAKAPRVQPDFAAHDAKIAELSADLEAAEEKLSTLQGNIDSVMGERDAAVDKGRQLQEQLDAADRELAALRNAAADTAKENAGLGIASTKGETLADIKAGLKGTADDAQKSE